MAHGEPCVQQQHRQPLHSTSVRGASRAEKEEEERCAALRCTAGMLESVAQQRSRDAWLMVEAGELADVSRDGSRVSDISRNGRCSAVNSQNGPRAANQHQQQRRCINVVDWATRELSIVSVTLVINSLSQLFVVEYISQMIVMWNGRTRPEG